MVETLRHPPLGLEDFSIAAIHRVYGHYTPTVEAIAALLTGQSFGVGQMLPAGYDAYNVPYAYRDQYADSADNMYRYADGSIYRVDPQTRVIQAVIDAVT